MAMINAALFGLLGEEILATLLLHRIFLLILRISVLAMSRLVTFISDAISCF
ncbi:hypothetical protein PMIT1303_00001 [Prochlorococcus sp. MIT 1303]|nr:hypothetical protein PMIT1303_00001 [Prochlorococcus sp. MIT 1303]